MLLIRSLIFNLVFYPLMLGWAMLSSVLGLFVPRKTIMFMWNKIFMRACRLLLRLVCGITIEVRGAENISNKPAVYACKHQSALETYFMTTILSKAIFVMKKELLYLPFLGWTFLFYGMIPVDRKKGGAVMKEMLKSAKERIKSGLSIIIFPEGTRTKVCERGKYKPGVTLLYKSLDVDVIPVATNTGFFWPKNSFMRNSGKVVFDFMEPMPKNLDKDEFIKLLGDKIEDRCAKINAETFENYPKFKRKFKC